MADIFVEVDEAMKQERLEKAWHQYGGLFITFLAMVILGTAANAGYKSWNKSKNAEQTSILLTALDQNDSSAEILKVSPQLRDKLRGLANLRAAGLSLENGDNEIAIQTYSDLSNDKTIDPAISQLASYMSLNLDNNLSAGEKLDKLNAITYDSNNPWRFHAHLDAALIEANETGNYTSARTHLAEILKSDNVAQTLKQKAQSLDIIYTLKEKI